MSDAFTAIMDAAERRMRVGGFNGFSFRDIAADVGMKSSSVHYHFPTKEKLAAAVIDRYTAATALLIEKELASGDDAARVLTLSFRQTLRGDGHMCPCVVLGAGAQDLPEEVARAVRRFFEMCLDRLGTAGLSRDAASRLLSTVSGALVLANTLNDPEIYDAAVQDRFSFLPARTVRPCEKGVFDGSRLKAF